MPIFKLFLDAPLMLLLFVFAAGQVRADGILLSWSASSVPGVTEQSFSDAKKLNAAQILVKNIKAGSWLDAFLVMVAATGSKDDKNFLKSLAGQLTDKTTAPLKNTSRLIIWERITSGEIMFEGKGYQVDDDLFSVAGRSNWILRSLTKKNFGYVKSSTSAEDLLKLQQKWVRFLAGETVEEYRNPFETSQKGLSEIRSLEALEALITSLAPSKQKDKLTKDCLQKLYGLDELPKEPGSPAALCSPDSMTGIYLSTITGIKEKHRFEWWKSWWETSRNRLEFSPDQGLFELKK